MGNKIDLELLINQAGDSLWRFCLRLEKTRLDAEDLYQEAILKTIKLQDKIELNKNPKAFLFSIAVGIHKNKFRKFFRRIKLAPPSDKELESVSSPYEILPEIELEKKELKGEIEKAIFSLPEKIKISVLMFSGDIIVQFTPRRKYRNIIVRFCVIHDLACLQVS